MAEQQARSGNHRTARLIAIVAGLLGTVLAIAGYLGKSEAFENAVADFAERYADVNERDHAALAEAVASGRVKAAAES